MERSEEKRYESLSPFELKNKLIQMAKDNKDLAMLNAGRGNPNWLAVEPRDGFFLFGQFAMEEVKRVMIRSGFGQSPKQDGVWQHLQDFIARNKEASG